MPFCDEATMLPKQSRVRDDSFRIRTIDVHNSILTLLFSLRLSASIGGGIPRVAGSLAVTRAFGDAYLKTPLVRAGTASSV